MASSKRPTPLELEVLRVFWRVGRAQAGAIHRELELSRPVARNTVNTIIGVLVDKGFVSKVKESRPQEFEAAIAQDDLQRSFAADLRSRIFDGSLRKLVTHAFVGKKPTKQELADLRKLIDDAEGDR